MGKVRGSSWKGLACCRTLNEREGVGTLYLNNIWKTKGGKKYA